MKNLLDTLFKQNNEHQELSAKLLANFSWLFAGTAGKLIIGFIASLYLARVLGPQGFGQVAFAQVLLIYFMLFTDCGLQTLGTREIAAASEDKGRIVAKIITIRLFLIMISLAILLTFAPLLTPSSTTKYLLIMFSFALIPVGLNLAWFFRGLEKMMVVGVSEVLQATFNLALLFILVKKPDQLFFIPIIFVGGYILSTLYLSWIYTHRRRLPKFSTSITDNWEFFRAAVPMAITVFLHQIYYNFDTLMLGFLRSEKEVGLYNAAYRVIMALISINMVFMQSIYPTFSKAYKIKPLEVSNLLKKTLNLSIIFAIPIGIGGTIMGRSIIVTLFGSEFAGGTLSFQILVWSVSLAFIGANYGYCLIACKQERVLAFSAGIGTAVNITLNLLLIPSHGIFGASLATIIATVVMLLCQGTFFSLRLFPTFPSIHVTLKALFSSLVIAFLMIYLKSILSLFAIVAVSIVVYFSIFLLLGGLNQYSHARKA